MTLPFTSIKITPEEHEYRCEALRQHIDGQGLNGAVLFDRHYILYYTGFAFIPTERPIAFAINRKGERMMFVPRLEVEHAKSLGLVDHIAHYPEYPHNPHPMTYLAKALHDLGITGWIGADHDGYPWIFGYRGQKLSELVSADVMKIAGFVEDQMMVKSEREIALVREACKWANIAHTLLQRYTRVGLTETEVSQRASDEATRALYDTLGGTYRAQSEYYSGAVAGYRGQIGRAASIPHALANNVTFQTGDVLVTGAASAMWGYNSELERTMIIGKPTDEQRRMFDHMCALQEIGMLAIKPGAPCSDVDRAVRAYYEQHDLMDYWRHHVGHAIGLRYHEAPFLDIGDDTIIKPGMIFTVEPGLYSPGLGGFRHSDTVLVTPNGIEILTYYPRDLESLTLPG